MLTYLAGIVARLRREDQGQTMVEYALILFLVSIVSIIILTTLGVNIQGVFNTITGALV